MNKSQIKIGLRIVAAALIMIFLAATVAGNFDQLAEAALVFSPGLFLFSTFLVLAQFIQQALCWRLILASSTEVPPAGESISIWLVSQLSRYVPGKMMLPLVRHDLLGRQNTGFGIMMVSIYIELLVTTAAAAAAALVISAGWDDSIWQAVAAAISIEPSGANLKLVALFSIPLLGAAASPGLLRTLINKALSLAGRPPIKIDLSRGRLLFLGISYFSGWFIGGLGAVLLFSSLGLGGDISPALIAFGFIIAWIVGFWSIITPAGMGVREAVFTGIITLAGVPVAAAATVVIIARLQLILAEIIGATLFHPFRRNRQNNSSPAE